MVKAQPKPDGNNILYVDQQVDIEADGYSGVGDNWINAIPELRDALAWAQSWDGETDGTLQIWVAKGIYLPVDVENAEDVTNTERNSTFQLITGVAIYGGFAGTEESLGERNWQDHPTILSEDIDGNDTTTANEKTDTSHIEGSNAYHVVTGTGSGSDNTAILDGFTIIAGQANGSGTNTRGGGMNNEEYSSPTLTDVAFVSNEGNSGGGMRIEYSSPSLTNTTFSGNWATSDNRRNRPVYAH